MKARSALTVVFTLAVSLTTSLPAFAAGQSQTFLLELEVPNTAVAPNGDTVAITGEGEFSVFPNSVEAEGEFVHSNSAGAVLATGTWSATSLLTYQSYGCGVLFGEPIPPEFCGGKVSMTVQLTPTGTALRIPAMLTVFCVIGDHVPGSAEEGVRLNVQDIINFTHATGGDNVYIRIA
jgi:hypothetical protein